MSIWLFHSFIYISLICYKVLCSLCNQIVLGISTTLHFFPFQCTIFASRWNIYSKWVRSFHFHLVFLLINRSQIKFIKTFSPDIGHRSVWICCVCTHFRSVYSFHRYHQRMLEFRFCLNFERISIQIINSTRCLGCGNGNMFLKWHVIDESSSIFII